MDFYTNNQLTTMNTTTESPFLNLDAGSRQDQPTKLMGDLNCLWHPYTRLTSAEGASIQLPAAMLDNPSTNINNNFDGVLDADSCSEETFSNDDSSDMDTFSDVDITDQSDDEQNQFAFQNTAGGAAGQGCGYYYTDAPTTFLTTTTTKIDDETLAFEEINLNNDENNNIIIEGRDRARGRGRRDQAEEEFSFSFKKQEKAKPKLPEVVLQGLDLSSSVSEVVEHIVEHEHEDDDCMAAGACGMSQAQELQAQDSF